MAAAGIEPEEPPGLEVPGPAYAAEAPEPEPAAHPADAPVPDEGPTHHEAPFPETERETATPPHGDPVMPHQPTREFSADELEAALAGEAPPQDVVPADAEPGEEDVLEE